MEKEIAAILATISKWPTPAIEKLVFEIDAYLMDPEYDAEQARKDDDQERKDEDFLDRARGV